MLKNQERTGSSMYVLIMMFLILFQDHCPGQQDTSVHCLPALTGLKFSFNQSVLYPGLGAGIEFTLQSTEIGKIRKSGKQKHFLRDRILSVNPGWYHHPGFHDNLYVSAEWSMRRIKSNGTFNEFSAGAGYSRTFLGGTTYKVRDNGEVMLVKGAGYNYAMMVVGGKKGYDLSKKGFLPLTCYVSIEVLMMFPYNSIIYVRPVIGWGVLIPLKGSCINQRIITGCS